VLVLTAPILDVTPLAVRPSLAVRAALGDEGSCYARLHILRLYDGLLFVVKRRIAVGAVFLSGFVE
jgi:hypothetical protein